VSRTSPLLALLLSGCAASLGTVGVIRPDAEEVGFKLLLPAVSARSCRDSIVGVPLQRGEPDVREALARLRALDAEGDVVANAEIRWLRIVTGIYNRRCVEVRGDLARAVSMIRLPAPPGHEGHGRH
jgi:hypothetical protein